MLSTIVASVLLCAAVAGAAPLPAVDVDTELVHGWLTHHGACVAVGEQFLHPGSHGGLMFTLTMSTECGPDAPGIIDFAYDPATMHFQTRIDGELLCLTGESSLGRGAAHASVDTPVGLAPCSSAPQRATFWEATEDNKLRDAFCLCLSYYSASGLLMQHTCESAPADWLLLEAARNHSTPADAVDAVPALPPQLPTDQTAQSL